MHYNSFNFVAPKKEAQTVTLTPNLNYDLYKPQESQADQLVIEPNNKLESVKMSMTEGSEAFGGDSLDFAKPI